jgi:asparagine synthase (glutamine-hydrolysing)
LCNGIWLDAINDEAKARKVKIMLCGNLGNATFSYNGFPLLSDFLRMKKWGCLMKEATALVANGTRATSILAQAAGPHVPPGLWKILHSLTGRTREITEFTALPAPVATSGEFLKRAAAQGYDLSFRPWRDSIEHRLWMIAAVDPGNYNKGMLGGWGIDYRDPSSDRRLVEFCLSVPLKYFLQNGKTRALARGAFRDRLPHQLLAESRKGYQAVDWHENLDAARHEAAALIDSIEERGAAAASIDVNLLRKLATNWPSDGWERRQSIARYRLTLLRGLSGGHFLLRAADSFTARELSRPS